MISDLSRLAALRRLQLGLPVEVRAGCNIFTFAEGQRLEVSAGTVGELVDVTHEGNFALVRWPADRRLHRTFWDHVELVEQTTS